MGLRSARVEPRPGVILKSLVVQRFSSNGSPVHEHLSADDSATGGRLLRYERAVKSNGVGCRRGIQISNTACWRGIGGNRNPIFQVRRGLNEKVGAGWPGQLDLKSIGAQCKPRSDEINCIGNRRRLDSQ